MLSSARPGPRPLAWADLATALRACGNCASEMRLNLNYLIHPYLVSFISPGITIPGMGLPALRDFPTTELRCDGGMDNDKELLRVKTCVDTNAQRESEYVFVTLCKTGTNELDDLAAGERAAAGRATRTIVTTRKSSPIKPARMIRSTGALGSVSMTGIYLPIGRRLRASCLNIGVF